MKIKTMNLNQVSIDWLAEQVEASEDNKASRSKFIRVALNKWLPLLKQEVPSEKSVVITCNLEEQQFIALTNAFKFGVESGSELVRLCLLLEQAMERAVKKAEEKRKEAERSFIEILSEDSIRIGTKAYKIVPKEVL